MQKVKIIFNIFLGIIGIATLLVLAGHFGIFNTVRPYIVQSGSMSPSIPLGSVVLVRTAPYYGQNDIITFRQNNNPKNLVTHRIVYKKFANVSSEPTYFTIGDTNDDIDRYEVKNSDIVGKVYFSIPYVGYAVDFAKTPKGFILLVIIPATIIIYEELRVVLRELSKVLKKKKIEERIHPTTRHNLPKAAMVVPIIGVALVFVAVTGSFFLDKEQSNENVMGAASSFATISPTPTPTPTLTPGIGDVVINEIMWMGSSESAVDEWVELRNTTGNLIDISNWIVTDLGDGTPSADITIPLGNSIPANGFFLISNFDDENVNTILGVNPDVFTPNVGLLNGGEQLILKDNNGTTIDTANGGGGWFAGSNVHPRASMARKDPPGDGTIAGNWFTSSTSANLDPTASESATPKAANGL